jgi:hypothetical protein
MEQATTSGGTVGRDNGEHDAPTTSAPPPAAQDRAPAPDFTDGGASGDEPGTTGGEWSGGVGRAAAAGSTDGGASGGDSASAGAEWSGAAGWVAGREPLDGRTGSSGSGAAGANGGGGSGWDGSEGWDGPEGGDGGHRRGSGPDSPDSPDGPGGPDGPEGGTDVHERARQGVEHLQAAARELIAAARAALDVADDMVNDPEGLASLAGLVSGLGDMARRFAGGGWPPSGTRGPEPEDERQAKVERIRVT